MVEEQQILNQTNPNPTVRRRALGKYILFAVLQLTQLYERVPGYRQW